MQAAQLTRATPATATPTVRALLDGVRSGRPHLLVRGTAGTGKSALLALVRERVPGTVSTGVTGGAEPAAGEALIVDDAHLLPQSDLDALTALATRTDLTIVVATEPRPGNPGLRALTAALDGTVTLGNLTAREIVHRSERVLGSFCHAGFDNDPSAGSPTETLLRLLLPLNDKVQWTSRDVADSEPATSPRSENFTGPFNR